MIKKYTEININDKIYTNKIHKIKKYTTSIDIQSKLLLQIKHTIPEISDLSY